MQAEVEPDVFLSRLRQTRQAIDARWGKSGIGRPAVRLLDRLDRHLACPLRAVFLGEANSGKTSLVNRLLGSELLATDVIQNTCIPVLVRHSARPELAARHADGRREALRLDALRIDVTRIDRLEIGLPLPRLQRIELLDTPGAVPDDGVEAPWVGAARRADIVVWCTIATQAWRATEIACWGALGRAADASLLVATRSYLVRRDDREKIQRRLQNEAQSLFSDIVVAGGAGDSSAVASEVDRALDRIAGKLRQKRCRKAAAIVGRHLERLSGGRSDTRGSRRDGSLTTSLAPADPQRELGRPLPSGR